MRPLVSIVIVNYKLKKELHSCLQSIVNSEKKLSYEVIVVDNSPTVMLNATDLKKFPKVKYVMNPTNTGYGGGNNLGAKIANGKFIFFLNPDTTVEKNAISNLVKSFSSSKRIGIAGPLLLKPTGQPYELQGTKKLTPLRAIFGLSFLNKFFPNNPIAKNYWQKGWDKTKEKEVDVIPGTAFMIRRELFKKTGGFDEHFFLYFEEADLCNRVKSLGYKIVITPKSRVTHIWGASTKKSSENIKAIFKRSRFYYFKKNFGFLNALFLEMFLRFSKTSLLFIGTFLLGAFLRLYNINYNYGFYAEVGDNLLDIKNAYIHHYIPLLGPPTSHPWLYFGPLFYWLYGPILVLSRFNPLSHAYFGAFISLLTIIANYFTIKKIFNEKVALFSSFLIVISPLYMIAVRVSRFIYLVPLFIYPFLWFLYKIVKEQKKYYFWLAFLFGVMLNFHYSPIIFAPVVVTIFYIKKIVLKKTDILKLVCGFLIPQIPLLLFDGSHSFTMVKNFSLWIPYKILSFLHLYTKKEAIIPPMDSNFSFISFFSSNFIPHDYYPFTIIGFVIFGIILLYIFGKILQFFKQKLIDFSWLLLLTWSIWGFVAIFIHGSPPLHYFSPLYPIPLFFFSLLLSSLWAKKYGKQLALLILLALSIVNFSYYFSSKWFVNGSPTDYHAKQLVTKTIAKDAKGQKFELKRVGYNDKFPMQFAQDYIFLLWLYGNEPVSHAKLTYVVYEDTKVPPTRNPLITINSQMVVEKIKHGE